MLKQADIDIDVPDRDKALASLDNYVNASIINTGVIKPHNVGVYLQKVPTYLDTNLCSIDYKQANDYGFFKLDILTNNAYEGVKDEQHMDRLLNTEPDWTMLLDNDIVSELFQIHNYYQLLTIWKPSSITELAIFIAMIRPSKKHLFQCNTWEEVSNEIWKKPADGSQFFKKSHAISYAGVIVIQLNLINNVE